jgi:two-component system NarL family sensor kinase
MGKLYNSDAEALTRRNRELTILNVIAQALNREVDLSQALHTTLARVAEIFDLQTGWIWLMHPDTGEPYLAAAQNLPPGLANFPRRMQGWCYCLETYEAGDLEGAANVNVVTCSRLKNLVDGTDGLRYHASIPLYAHEKKLGVLNVSSPDWRQLSSEDLRLLHIIGDLLSIAVERARLFERSIQLGAVEERNRLAREIHDTLAQGLTGIALNLETADALLESEADPEQARLAIGHALGLVRASLEEARRSVMDLRAAPLEGRSLPEALQALADSMSDAKLQVVCDLPENLPPLPVRIEVGLYRIAQEALNNIRAHANAQKAELILAAGVGKINLSISDNGSGFDPASVPAGRYGIVGLNERAKLLGGSLQLTSALGQGTLVQVSVPL